MPMPKTAKKNKSRSDNIVRYREKREGRENRTVEGMDLGQRVKRGLKEKETLSHTVAQLTQLKRKEYFQVQNKTMYTSGAI